MAKLQHIVTDLHQVYLTEMEAKIKPQLGSSSSSGSDGGEKKSESGGGGEDGIKKAARQLAYDTRYKARREGIPLERAFAQSSANSKASAPVKDAAKAMLFSGPKEEVEHIEEKDEGKPGLMFDKIARKAAKKYGSIEAGKRVAGAIRKKVLNNEVELEDNEDIQELKKGDKEMVRVTPKKGYGKGYVRFADRKKQSELRKNPQIQSVTGTNYGEPYEGKYKTKPGEKNTVGDKDGDGTKEPNSHEYAGVKDKAIKKAVAKKEKKEKLNASFSDWRADLVESGLIESASKGEQPKKLTEKDVNNKIVINPNLEEEVILEVVDIAANFFCHEGLNSTGVDILIEELGLEEFTTFVFELAEEHMLTEARAGGVRVEPKTKAGKSVGQLKGGAKTAAINRLRKEKEARRSAEASASASKPSGMKAALSRQSAMANAKKQQPKKKGVLDRVAGAVLKGIDRHNAAMAKAKKDIETTKKVAKKVGKGASEFGKGVASGVRTTAKVAKAAHKVLSNSYDMLGEETPVQRIDRLNQERIARQREANQQQQAQRSASAAAFQSHKKEVLSKGGRPVDALDSWQKKKIENQKKSRIESIDPVSSLSARQQDTERQQAQTARADLELKKQESLRKKQRAAADREALKNEIKREVQRNSYEVDGEDIQEVSPPGMKGTVKAMKKHGEIDNPFALAWWMKKKGYKSHKKASGAPKEEFEFEEGLEQARKNVGASKCWSGKVARGTKMKDGREVPNCVPEENDLDEKTRYAKETGINFRKQKPQPEGGSAKNDKAFQHVSQMMRNMSGGRPAGQRPKVKGKKPPAAGQYGAPASPAQKVAKRRADAQRAKDNMSSRFD